MFTDTKTPILSSQELARLRDPALYMVTEGAENTWDVTHREAQVEFRIWRLDAPGTVAVDGTLNGGGVYTVRLGSRPDLHGCTCPDFQRRNRLCKHQAAAIQVAAHCAARRVLARMARDFTGGRRRPPLHRDEETTMATATEVRAYFQAAYVAALTESLAEKAREGELDSALDGDVIDGAILTSVDQDAETATRNEFGWRIEDPVMDEALEEPECYEGIDWAAIIAAARAIESTA